MRSVHTFMCSLRISISGQLYRAGSNQAGWLARNKYNSMTSALVNNLRESGRVGDQATGIKRTCESLNDLRTKPSKKSRRHPLPVVKKERICVPTETLRPLLECAICQETFLRPHSLKCSHTFCSHCINKWLRQKKVLHTINDTNSFEGLSGL